ncbi:ABC transporter permease [Caldimonas thermodepolymerans]|jgi:NitT/TauT family transport system permease protein|uniref:NitT/TauT family transport system permease protein n=1 Tax=Caldimonas thermodepolymerans TaxID=215580 RepID=A0AA46DCC3_9BURK|nr:ABC transporter permease [Caldimonas thermodepolymerans]TCP04960.1 NitT/TauT family transport system permease protein [Caldimonas thermodepolymerans]UZG44676.1 ABC transporter permease [Caldimonas thermodepolymerans]UZG48333.1 ABC transporter permease [Caldimonas thermodepolymerans]
MRAFLSRYASLWAFLLVLLLWEIAARAFQLPVYVLPAPSAIASAARELGVERWLEHLLATLEVAISGYLVAIAIALPLAVGITKSPLLSRTLLPWLVVIQSTPIVAIAPIIVVTLGAGTLPRVVITTLIAFFPIVISTATGLASVPAELIELSRTLRAPRIREYTQIRVPYAVPYIFSSLKVAITLSVIGAVVAEFVAAEKGLGYLILFATSSFKVPVAFASLAILVSCSLALYGLIVGVHKRFFSWSA